MERKIRGSNQGAINDGAQDPGFTPRANHMSPLRGLGTSMIEAPEARQMHSPGRQPRGTCKIIKKPLEGATDVAAVTVLTDVFGVRSTGEVNAQAGSVEKTQAAFLDDESVLGGIPSEVE